MGFCPWDVYEACSWVDSASVLDVVCRVGIPDRCLWNNNGIVASRCVQVTSFDVLYFHCPSDKDDAPARQNPIVPLPHSCYHTFIKPLYLSQDPYSPP